MKRIIFAAALLFGCLSAQAQTQLDANKLARFLATGTDQLAKSGLMLFYMENERPSPDADHICSTYGIQ